MARMDGNDKAAMGSGRATILCFTSNGIGMGHLARALAIARRLGPAFRPVVVTLSQAVATCSTFGIPAEHLPHHRYLGCDVQRWNASLTHELGLLLDSYAARLLLFDGTIPYAGLIDLLRARPGLPSVWCRVGMWHERPETALLEQEEVFTLVLEPGELAAEFDDGPTRRWRGRTVTVPPIRLLDDEELLTREAARAEIGLDPNRPAVLLALGSRNGDPTDAIHGRCLRHLASHPDVQVVVAEWLMSDRPLAAPASGRRWRAFPHARCLAAFDGAVAASGYGLFHELVASGVPTLFVPNEHPEADNQLARARWAESEGLGLCLREAELGLLPERLTRLLQPSRQEAMRASLALADRRNGAAVAAAVVATLARGSAPRPAGA